MIQMDGLGETEVVDVTMHMVAQERHFQDMNKTFWEFREKNMYTDLIFICQVRPTLLHHSLHVPLVLVLNIPNLSFL